jgi:uncharacterized protein
MTFTKRLRQILAGAALLTTAPLTAQQAAPAPAASAAPATTDADPAMWVIRDADTTIYLFGTMHMVRPGLTWFDEAVADAFNASTELRVEVNLPAEMAQMGPAMMTAATNGTGTLTSRMTEVQRTEYVAAMERLGVPYQQLEQFDAWFVSLQFVLQLTQRAGLSPENGADGILLAAAQRRGMTITAFESGADQVGFLDSMPESEQIDGLLMILRDMPAAVSYFNRLSDAWSSGDVDASLALINEARTSGPAQHRIMFTDRNRRWADSIEQRMQQPGTVFVAVGAGHLVGDDSVQAFLAQRGITATRVAY